MVEKTIKSARDAFDIAEHGSFTEPPHLGDLFASGIGSRNAASFRRAMKDNPDLPAGEWWCLLRELADKGAAGQ